MKKNVLICLDRDGTMIYDDGNYHLGRQRNWKSLIKFLPGVISGIKRLKKIDNVKIYMLTNQPGVARSDFPLLTFDKSLEVCVEILNQLERKGAGINGYEICPHMSPVDARKYKGVKFKKGLMCNCKCIKPKIGMVRDALDEEGWKLSETEVYFVGDRATDVLAGINAKGHGILVPFRYTPGQIEEFGKIKSRRKFLAKNFSEAVDFILGKV